MPPIVLEQTIFMKIVAVAMLLSFLPLEAETEAYYQKIFAKAVGGKQEVTLADKTRCDVLTETHAVEVEFG